ncbi:hypothetical protein RN001_010688 [Aquatica leii]|uniref:Uncharacterized protein n=1 Tax=Aquatica leii TaxID=1421715 RepID=A0AAN7PWN4_9COLE|nr:hypothetical protein RN001_010688 [Aquatica leii]
MYFSRIVSVLLLVVSLSNNPTVAIDTRIVNGTTATNGQYPYQASLRILGIHYCSGSILNTRWILTAAYCINQKPVFTVVVGSNTLNANGVTYQVSYYVKHPLFDVETKLYNAGLINTTTSISYSSNIQPIVITPLLPFDGVVAVITGWGTNSSGSVSTVNQLQSLNTIVINQTFCLTLFQGYPVDSTQICTFLEHGGACGFDDGSPVVVESSFDEFYNLQSEIQAKDEDNDHSAVLDKFEENYFKAVSLAREIIAKLAGKAIVANAAASTSKMEHGSVEDNGEEVALASAAHGSTAEMDKRIVGGTTATPGQFPYVVSLRTIGNVHFCGGSIIRPRWILTSAQCLSVTPNFKVVAGTNSLIAGGTVYQVARSIKHPSFNPTTYIYDAGLVQTTLYISFCGTVKPVYLTHFHRQVTASAVVSGWGSTGYPSTIPSTLLQYLITDVISNADCQRQITNLRFTLQSTHFCTFKSQSGDCVADDGGPLVVNSVQYGIVSVYACGLGYADVYTNVSSVFDWILLVAKNISLTLHEDMANEKIVISGIAGAFPNIENVAEFYTNLDNKIKSFNQIDPYWQIVTPGVPSVIGKLTFPEKFDAGYFGVHHKQADEMHQGCRMLLEQAVAAVIDSGINPDDLKGSKTGVFVANSVYESSEEWIWRKLSSPSFSLLGSKCSAMAEWISYYLQLQGPTVTSNSACASSLYSLDQAVMAIKTGKCDSALICSFNVIQNPHIHFGLTQLGVLETNGVTNVFDDSCTGYVRSEAMAVVFLQKFQDAKRIYAEILNIKSNTDGFKEMGISHPSDEMLIDLVKEIYDEVGVDINTVSFVECHVTGTAAGMSQEIKGVEEAFCSDRKTPLLIGSVKAGIGHCEGASGLASLIKILIGLQHNCILPNQECQQLTRKPDALQNGKLVVLTERLTLPSDQDVIIGCNNFGFGGTNSHLVLKHCPNFQSTNQSSNSNRLVCFSARTMASLTKIINSLADNQTEEYLALLQNIFKYNNFRLYVLGFNLNLDKLYPNASWPVKAPSISPLIQWQHKDDWDILKYEMKNLSTDVATITLEHNHWKFLTGHVVDGRTVLPGTGYLFIVWNFYLKVNRFLMNQTKIIFENVKFYGLTFLFKQKPVALTVNLMKLQNKFEVLFGYFCVNVTSLDGTIGSIKWYNWITFLDNLFHFTVLNNQQHHLLIPFEFDQLFIDPLKHGQALYQYNNILPIHYNPVCNRINAPGVEIRNLILSSIKKQSQKDPYLGIYKFVPFYTNLSLENSVKVHIQLVAENLINTLKIIEVVDAFTSDTNELLYPIVDNVLDNEYSFIENLSIFSTKTLDYPNTIVKYKTIEQLPSGLSLVIMSCGSQRQTTVAQILENRSSFVLSRESLKYEKFKHIEVISTHRTNSENLVLLRKSRKIPQKVIEIKSDFGWLEQLKSTLLQNQKVLLVAQNDPTSGILGLVNCLKQEVDQNVSCLFLSDRVKRFDLEDDFYQKQLRKGLLINVFKNGQWGSYKHLPLYQGQKSCEHVIGVSRGKLTNIEFVEGPFTKKSLISDKDLIDIYCVGLNFKNAGAATEEISNVESNFEDLGTEFAGKDSKNSRIMGISLNSVFSNCISANTSITCQIPDEWSMEDAATVPAIYLTVLHALLKIARLKHGQSILIHSGTDNVGQSAINVALYYNCNIFTTIDSKEKRQYLKTLYPNILDSHIGNLGDTEFEQIILKQTNGRGVDVVISSLTDDKLSASIRCLNQSGIFVFLGKPDNKFFIDEVFERRTYASVSVDTFFNQPLNNKKEILSLLQEGITKGYVKPLPKTVYHRDQLQNSLSLSKHTNKIVIQIKNELVDNHSPLNAKPRFYCDPDKVYILIGGLGGFGLELTDWLITRNAKKIILVSRSGVTTGYQSYKLYCWKNLDCKVLSSQDDLTTEDGCIKLLTEANALGDVDGIFNLAIDLHDALIENQNENTFKTIWAPKVLITRNMDTISKKLCPRLRKFVMFSSLVCGRGNSGQSNYGMANSVAERICEQRKEDGYPALVIQWAFIGDVGLVADTPSAKVSIDRIRKQNIASCWNVIDTLLTHEETIVSSTVFDSKEIKQNANSKDILSTVAELLGETSLKHISMHSELSSLGINSISIIQLAQYLSAECNLHISLKELRNMTLHMLVEKNNAPKNST